MASGDDDEIDLGELLLTWVSEWRLIASSTVAAAIVAGTYAVLIAPEKFEASALVRTVPSYFCTAVVAPPVAEADPCGNAIATALQNAAATAVLPEGIAAIEPSVALSGDPFYAPADGPANPIDISLRLSKTVRITPSAGTATIVAEHSDGARAAAVANAIAGYIQNELVAAAEREMVVAESAAQRQLASLNSAAAAGGQAEALISIERAEIVARIEGISEAKQEVGSAAVLARPAGSNAQRTEPRTPLILVLGTLLGLFAGLGAALARGRKDARLYSIRAIAEAFRQAGFPAKAIVRLDRGRPTLGWQEAWLALGREARVTALAACAADQRVREAATGLAEAGTARSLTRIDLAGWLSQPGSKEPAPEVCAARPAELPEVLADLRAQDRHVLLLAPRSAGDLPGFAQALDAADSVLAIAQPGQITRAEVQRIALAAQGRVSQLVVLTV